MKHAIYCRGVLGAIEFGYYIANGMIFSGRWVS